MSEVPGQPPEQKRFRHFFHKTREALLSVGVVVAVRAAVILSFVLFFLWLPAPWLWQFAQTRLDNMSFFYDASREGLIVVDSPQVFTRERLVNQRLRDSDWIDRQLEKVDQMLEDNHFGTPDTISASQRILNVYQTAEDGADTDEGKEVDLQRLESLMRPDPLVVFEEAQMYREMLTQNRYETILDDAHDIGSNTLQRLNFRMTVSPARGMSDSLAAVTITIDEPESTEWLFQHYGRLLIETREELEETVKRLIADRSQIFNARTFSYALHPSSEAALNAAFEEKFNALTTLVPNDVEKRALVRNLIKLALTHQDAARDRQNQARARSYIFGSLPWVGFGEKLMAWGGSEATLRHAREVLVGHCDQPVTLWQLAGDSMASGTFFNKLLKDYKRVSTLRRSLDSAKSNGNSHEDAAGSRTDKQTSDRAEAELLQILHRPLTPLPCRRDMHVDLPQAKLRLVGAMHLLADSQRLNPVCGSTHSADYVQTLMAATDILLDRTPQNPKAPAASKARTAAGGECSQLIADVESMTQLTSDPEAKDRSLQRIGVADMIVKELESTAANSIARRRMLTDYFDIRHENCDLTGCGIVVRTFAEAYLRDNLPEDPTTGAEELKEDIEDQNLVTQQGKIDPAPLGNILGGQLQDADNPLSAEISPAIEPSVNPADIAERIAKEEALRLFAELSCFSKARSYTVWPRTGARQQLLQTEQDSMSLLSQVFNPLSMSATAENSQTTRRHIDRVFGIGDGGRSMVSAFDECDQPFFWMLSLLQPDGEFLRNYLKPETWHKADPVIRVWRDQRTCLLGVANEVGPWFDPELLQADGSKYPDKPALQRAQIENCATPPTLGSIPAEAIKQLLDRARLDDVAGYTRQMRQLDTNISWIVAPEQSSSLAPKAHIPRSIPLSAILSVPSWWPSARITIRTCWLRPKTMMHHIEGADFCQPVDENVQRSWFGPLDKRLTRLAGKGRTETTVTVPLPSNAQEVLPKLGFFLIRAPYLDQLDLGGIQVESGRSAQIRLTGSRLWKNPRVRLGAQWHDKIEVLPDMEGIIATFNCVSQIESPTTARVRLSKEPLIRVPNDKAAVTEAHAAIRASLDQQPVAPQNEQAFTNQRQVQIWTSEGVTGNSRVTVQAFRPSYLKDGGFEQPCWAAGDTPTASQKALE